MSQRTTESAVEKFCLEVLEGQGYRFVSPEELNRIEPERVIMEKELVYSLTQNFDSYAQTTNSGVEFWLTRDLQHLLEYVKWDNFHCELSDHEISDHFADVGKMVELG